MEDKLAFNVLALVMEEYSSLEWIYINGNQVASGEPISSEQWLEVIEKYGHFSVIEKFILDDQFVERLDGDFNNVPKSLDGFEDGDLI
jgi:hypothetical protein